MFEQNVDFRTIIYRVQATGEATGEVHKVGLVLENEVKRSEIQQSLQLKHDDYFRTEYFLPALEAGMIEQTHPESPNHPQQRYRLTAKGLQLQIKLKRK